MPHLHPHSPPPWSLPPFRQPRPASRVNGFSQKISLPAWAQTRITAPWNFAGVAITIAWMSGRSTRASTAVVVLLDFKLGSRLLGAFQVGVGHRNQSRLGNEAAKFRACCLPIVPTPITPIPNFLINDPSIFRYPFDRDEQKASVGNTAKTLVS